MGKIIGIVAIVLLLGFGIWKFTSKVDPTDPVKVGTAFSKAMKNQDTSGASKYFLPDKAVAWRDNADEQIGKMRTNALHGLFDNIPDNPGFVAPGPSTSGTMTLLSSDKTWTLEMTKVGSNWYVSKAPI